jgi:hypothetical protein
MYVMSFLYCLQRIGAWRSFVAVPDFVSGIKLQNKPDTRSKPPRNCAKPVMAECGSKGKIIWVSCPDPKDRIRKTEPLQVE